MSGPRLLLTRPREDSLALAAELARHGVESLIEPMMTIRIDDDARLELSGVQAILLTSANGARALAATSPDEEARRLPVLAVGGCRVANDSVANALVGSRASSGNGGGRGRQVVQPGLVSAIPADGHTPH